MKTIVKLKFGSHLYGTDTPESDLDFKGIFFPSFEDCVLNRISKSINNSTNQTSEKNSKDDVDEELYSLQYFLQLAFQGETVAIDMLHAPDQFLVETSPEWQFIRNNRSRFYTKNLKAYIGYCKKQAAKYGIKGSRLADAKKVMEFIKKQETSTKLGDVWDKLPEGENIRKYIDQESQYHKDQRMYEVCGKKVHAQARVEYAYDIFNRFYNSYGARALQAEKNEGIDWKAMSHAFRAGYQLKEIMETGDLKFPLAKAEFIKGIKLGKYHYKNDNIGNMLDKLVDEVYILSENSNFPEKVDQDFWNNWLVSLYK